MKNYKDKKYKITAEITSYSNAAGDSICNSTNVSVVWDKGR